MARESHDRWLQEISDGRNDRVFRFALPGYILSLLSKAPVERKARMFGSSSMEKLKVPIGVLCLIAFVGVACKLSSLTGAKTNMFEGANAQDGAAKIKTKVGSDTPKVSRMEIHENRLEIIVQDPNKPKNFDKYTYEKGAVKGPEPVEALVLGNQEFTADKSRLFDLSEINLAAVPETCRKAAERAQIEQGKCETISVDWESASNTRTRAENEKKQADERAEFQRQMKSGKMEDPMARTRKQFGDLVVTWRIWIRGPRATKYFWADAKGNLSDHQ